MATLNNANVPPPQMIEVVRYMPVALVDQGQPFVQYIQDQTAQGVTGPALIPVIVQRLRTYFPATPIYVTVPTAAPAPPSPPPAIVVDQNFVPPVVVTRLEEWRRNPQQVQSQVEQAPRPMISSTPAPVPMVRAASCAATATAAPGRADERARSGEPS